MPPGYWRGERHLHPFDSTFDDTVKGEPIFRLLKDKAAQQVTCPLRP